MTTASDIVFFRAERKRRPRSMIQPDVAHWVETRRVLPSQTPFPGYWRNERTPYLVEVMNNMSPASPVQHTALMKGCQLGATAAAENVIAYWIGESPASILYVSATDDLLDKWAAKRLEPLIDSCGLRSRIFAQVLGGGSRRTGDRIRSKEFIGGSLDMASAQSAPGLRSDSIRILIRDEIDGAPSQLKTGEGNWLSVSYGRTAAWGARKKIFDFSTPTTDDDSLIKLAYENGDQRKFEVPCPHCGIYQVLEWGNDKTPWGIKAERKAGILEAVYYQCAHCKEPIRNHHKTQMLSIGRWVPTARSTNGGYRSYHISSLYSPVGMLDWFEMQQLYDQAQNEPDGMRSFVNLYLGLPFRETGSRPKLDRVVELRGGYSMGTVPHGVLFLTAGIDVQAGSSRDPDNPPRLEMEVCGHGAGFKSWSILYRRFEGAVDDPAGGAWAALNEWALTTRLQFPRSDGLVFTPSMIFVDSGDGNLTDVVYHFCAGWGLTFPSKGFSALRKRKEETGDEAGPSNFRRYRAIKLGEDSYLYEISTNYYKTHVYNNLKIERQDTGEQRPGFCDFPREYSESYFRMLTAEEKHRDGSFHCPSGRRNEALDVRVQNLCACDIYLDSEVLRVKAAAMKDGATRDQVQVINHRVILSELAKLVAPRKIKLDK
jgi:phage terminase large subunit GpA-like protein